MVCPDEMSWDDSKKSCFGEGACNPLHVKFVSLLLDGKTVIIAITCSLQDVFNLFPSNEPSFFAVIQPES